MFSIAIVGAGAVGEAHSDAIMNNPDCTLVAVADIAEQRAFELAAKHNALCFTDYKKMCDEVKIDAVIINLPHYLHCEASIYFMEKGIHVLVEKPMAMNLSECDKMINTSKECGVKLAVGHVQKYYSAYREIKKIIQNGSMGELCMITETRNTDYLQNRPGWFLKKSMSGGGIVMNYGAHTVDKIMYTTGLSVENSQAYLANPLSDDDVEINAQLFLKLSGGVNASITYCGCHTPVEYITSFYFTNGVAKVTEAKNLVISQNGVLKNIGGTENLFEEQLAEFVKLLKGEHSEAATPEYGREIIRVIENIYE